MMQKRSTVFGMLVAVLVMSSSVLALNFPLHQAVVAGDLDRVRVLIADGVDVNMVDGDGTTALHWAAHHDDLESGRELLNAGADPTLANQFGAQPIALASENGSAKFIQLLLDAGANTNVA